MFLYQVPEPWRHLIYAENSRQSSHLATFIDFRDFGWQQRYARFCGRVVVLSILSVLLYPFLWVWTVIGTLWFSSAKNCVSFFLSPPPPPPPACSVCGEYLIKMRTCFSIFQLPEEGQKWGFLIWLLFSYCGLFCIACMSAGKVSYTLRYLNLMTCFPAYLWGSLVSFLLHTFY